MLSTKYLVNASVSKRLLQSVQRIPSVAHKLIVAAATGCPPHSSGFPNCVCDRDYVGSIAWNIDRFDGVCTSPNEGKMFVFYFDTFYGDLKPTLCCRFPDCPKGTFPAGDYAECVGKIFSSLVQIADWVFMFYIFDHCIFLQLSPVHQIVMVFPIANALPASQEALHGPALLSSESAQVSQSVY
jgi:hypothetical protein